MARMRTLKPSLFTDDELAELPIAARYLFTGLWCIADREGRFEDRPKRIKVELLPFDDEDVDELLQALADEGFITRYEVGGKRLAVVNNFLKHQRPHHKEEASILPSPPKHGPSMKQASTNDAGTIREDPPNVAPSSSSGSGNNKGTGTVAVVGREHEPTTTAASEKPVIFTLYEQTIGALDAHIATKLMEAEDEYSRECIEHCFAEASELNKRNWRYVAAILKRHKAEGCFSGKRTTNGQASDGVNGPPPGLGVGAEAEWYRDHPEVALPQSGR